jgi:hypothetical protein
MVSNSYFYSFSSLPTSLEVVQSNQILEVRIKASNELRVFNWLCLEFVENFVD